MTEFMIRDGENTGVVLSLPDVSSGEMLDLLCYSRDSLDMKHLIPDTMRACDHMITSCCKLTPHPGECRQAARPSMIGRTQLILNGMNGNVLTADATFFGDERNATSSKEMRRVCRFNDQRAIHPAYKLVAFNLKRQFDGYTQFPACIGFRQKFIVPFQGLDEADACRVT